MKTYDSQGRYTKGWIKRVRWFPEDEKWIKQQEFHTSFHLGTDILKIVKVADPVEVIIGNGDERDRHFGIAEVVAIKTCRISDIDPIDYQRQKSGFKSKQETLATLRMFNPELRADINGLTEVTVVTLRRCDYDLKKLNSIVKSKMKGRKLSPISK